MKNKKELNPLKKETEPLNKKPRALTDEELLRLADSGKK